MNHAMIPNMDNEKRQDDNHKVITTEIRQEGAECVYMDEQSPSVRLSSIDDTGSACSENTQEIKNNIYRSPQIFECTIYLGLAHFGHGFWAHERGPLAPKVVGQRSKCEVHHEHLHHVSYPSPRPLAGKTHGPTDRRQNRAYVYGEDGPSFTQVALAGTNRGMLGEEASAKGSQA